MNVLSEQDHFIWHKTMLTCQDNAATTAFSFSMYYKFNKVLFDYLKAYYHILPEPDVEWTPMLVTSDISSYDLTGLNDKIQDKPLTRRIMHEDMDPIYNELEQTLPNMLKTDKTKAYGNEEKFQ